MIKVVGIQIDGVWLEGPMFFWGAAILDEGTLLRNSLLGRRIEKSQAMEDQDVVWFEDPLPVPTEFQNAPLIGLALRTNVPHYDVFLPPAEQDVGCLGQRSKEGICFLVLSCRDLFRAYRRSVFLEVLERSCRLLWEDKSFISLKKVLARAWLDFLCP